MRARLDIQIPAALRRLAAAAAILAAAVAAAVAATPAALTLVEQGRTRYTIVIDPQATHLDSVAALKLQKYIESMGGARIPIETGNYSARRRMIWLGTAGRVSRPPVAVDWERLGPDGFTLRSDGTALMIAGGTRRGTLYAVSTLLEQLGCRMYSPTEEFVPRSDTVVIQRVNSTQVPLFRFRDVHFHDPAYIEWHRLDRFDSLFGMYVHTFRTLVPPSVYFKDHPEYFSLGKGGRLPDAQLCLTNPDVFTIVVSELRKRMNEHPEKVWWSVSQNDTFSPCECPACAAIDSAEGSHAGSLLAFVNRVADEFPDKIISTLAYQYSRSAPKTIVPRRNVNIMLCSIECPRNAPLEADTSAGSFIRDLRDWTRLTHNIYLWDYVVQFRNYLDPFPNLRVLQPNIRLFARYGIDAVFEQGSGRMKTEFAELRTYLIGKLLWNPELNVDSVMNDFLRGYYGPAGRFVRKYIDLMHDALAASGESLVIYGYPLPSANGYLSPGNIDAYEAIFDSAETAVRGDSTFLRRVRSARLPVQFARLEQAKIFGSGERGFFRRLPEGSWAAKPAMLALLDTFVNRCSTYGYGMLNESGRSPREYLASTKEYLEKSMASPLTIGRPIVLDGSPSPNYAGGKPGVLVDGIRGWADYNMNWLGFEEGDMSATIDLGSVTQIREISATFLQDDNAWIFYPREVDFEISEDGLQFRRVGEKTFDLPPAPSAASVAEAKAEFAPVATRYIRIRAANRKACPLWHKGAGGKAWLFVDELCAR
jgi:hypothetical protein